MGEQQIFVEHAMLRSYKLKKRMQVTAPQWNYHDQPGRVAKPGKETKATGSASGIPLIQRGK